MSLFALLLQALEVIATVVAALLPPLVAQVSQRSGRRSELVRDLLGSSRLLERQLLWSRFWRFYYFLLVFSVMALIARDWAPSSLSPSEMAESMMRLWALMAVITLLAPLIAYFLRSLPLASAKCVGAVWGYVGDFTWYSLILFISFYSSTVKLIRGLSGQEVLEYVIPAYLMVALSIYLFALPLYLATRRSDLRYFEHNVYRCYTMRNPRVRAGVRLGSGDVIEGEVEGIGEELVMVSEGRRYFLPWDDVEYIYIPVGTQGRQGQEARS